MPPATINKRLPLIQDADLNGKVVLLRVDHNVVKDGLLKDPFRIDKTLGTLYYIVDHGGRPILMTHLGRPKDHRTGHISYSPYESVEPVVEYLERKLHTKFFIPESKVDPEQGISEIGNSIYRAVGDLKDRKIGGIYLPNMRWFRGEESEGFFRDNLAVYLSDLADLYVNDAFGSWQPHVSTYDITKFIPSYAGFLMQQEIMKLDSLINPEKPFLAVIGGSRLDNKIRSLNAIYNKADHLILGGVVYNAYLCAKYGISIKGVSDSDIEAMKELVKTDKAEKKILELPYVVESDNMSGKISGRYRTISVDSFGEGDSYEYIVDIDSRSFDDSKINDAALNAKTIFVSNVIGYTPHFFEGSRALDDMLSNNKAALKMFGWGDTLQELKNFCPGLYLSVLEDARYYFFTGGSTVLYAIEQGSPYGLKPIQALMDNKARLGTSL